MEDYDKRIAAVRLFDPFIAFPASLHSPRRLIVSLSIRFFFHSRSHTNAGRARGESTSGGGRRRGRVAGDRPAAHGTHRPRTQTRRAAHRLGAEAGARQGAQEALTHRTPCYVKVLSSQKRCTIEQSNSTLSLGDYQQLHQTQAAERRLSKTYA